MEFVGFVWPPIESRRFQDGRCDLCSNEILCGSVRKNRTLPHRDKLSTESRQPTRYKMNELKPNFPKGGDNLPPSLPADVGNPRLHQTAERNVTAHKTHQNHLLAAHFSVPNRKSRVSRQSQKPAPQRPNPCGRCLSPIEKPAGNSGY